MASVGMRMVVGVRRHPHWSLAALVGLLAVPYALLGVGWVLDDWFVLRNAHFDGPVAAAGREQWLARPGQGAVYALTFGLVGPHPLAIYAIQVVLAATTASCSFGSSDPSSVTDGPSREPGCGPSSPTTARW
jgi:hypothetical protein